MTAIKQRSERGRRYDKHLRTEAWRQMRAAVGDRAGGWCERCGVGLLRDTHHLHYETVGNEKLEDLQGLCRPCHLHLSGLVAEDPLAADYGGADEALVRWVFQEASLRPQVFERMLQRLQKEAWETWFLIRKVLDIRLRHTSPYTR